MSPCGNCSHRDETHCRSGDRIIGEHLGICCVDAVAGQHYKGVDVNEAGNAVWNQCIEDLAPCPPEGMAHCRCVADVIVNEHLRSAAKIHACIVVWHTSSHVPVLPHAFECCILFFG